METIKQNPENLIIITVYIIAIIYFIPTIVRYRYIRNWNFKFFLINIILGRNIPIIYLIVILDIIREYKYYHTKN